MDALLKLFRTKSDASDYDETDYEALRAHAMYPDLIGRKVQADAQTPYWMRCDCGMLVMTHRELSGQDTVCASCKRAVHDAIDMDMRGEGASTRNTAMRPATERRILFGLVVGVLLIGWTMTQRMYDAPARAHADNHVQLD